MNLKKKAIIAGVLVILLSCKDKTASSDTEKKTFVLSDTMLKTTRLAKVQQKQLKSEMEFYGKIEADNNKLIEIYPVVGGNVVKVYVELGDYVKKGELLATIRSTEVAGFEKDLNDAKNDVLLASNNLKVAKDLFEGKLNTEREVFAAKSEFEKAQSQLRRIEETYKIYSMKPGAIYEVHSPISGFILQKQINQDMLLRNDHTNNIFDIAQIDDVWAMANVSESDIEQVKLGGDAEIVTLSYPDKIFKGKVDKIFNIIDTDTKSMKVRIKLNNPGFILKPEMKASIKISYENKESMLAIPSSAIIFDKSNNYVMIYKDRYNIETRKVETFRQVGGITYISSGLKLGETVVNHNQLLIYDALND
ncbi:MAG: efflux RND transporter periplasmic adaptor subunit [Paludibacter sp.]